MKTYIDYMNQISKEALFEGLLGFGLFADKLPGVFSSEAFYNYCKTKGFPKFEQKGRDYIRYETTRNTNIPRLISIPNPFAYSNLCKHISEHWEELKNVFSDATLNQNYKISQIHIQKLKNKKQLFEMNKHYTDKDYSLSVFLDKLQITKRVRVSADISNCFPSIYSHSLPWAIVGKEVAKRSKDDKTLWFNELDYYVRNLKNEETNGLLIGPHSSNLLSELVLCRIDQDLAPNYNYIRNIDDFTCYVNSDDEAELFLLDLNASLKKYELALNTKKTEIIKLPISSASDWVGTLNSYHIGNNLTEDQKIVFKFQRLKAYLDLAISLANSTNNQSIYSYAIKTISNTYLGKRALSYYINTIHHLVCLYPYLVHWLEEFVFDSFHLSKETIREIAQDVYNVGINRCIYESCSFAIYWAIKYGFDLSCNHIDDSFASEDCIFMLLSYIKTTKEKYKTKADKKRFKEKAKSLIDDMDRYWLFIYEVLPKTDLPIGEFRAIKDKKVSFVKNEFL